MPNRTTVVIDKVRLTPKESISLLKLASRNMQEVETLQELEKAFEGYKYTTVSSFGGMREIQLLPPEGKGPNYIILKEV